MASRFARRSPWPRPSMGQRIPGAGPAPGVPREFLEAYSEIPRTEAEIRGLDRQINELGDLSDQLSNQGRLEEARDLVFEMNDLVNRRDRLREWLGAVVYDLDWRSRFAGATTLRDYLDRLEESLVEEEPPAVTPGGPALLPAVPAPGAPPGPPFFPPPGAQPPPPPVQTAPFSYRQAFRLPGLLAPVSTLPFGMGQLVQFRPDVQVSAPIQINLGNLPLSLGLFGGSVVTFLLGPQLPEGAPRTLATLAGAGLAVGGILNLFRGGGAPGAAAPGPLPGQPGGGFAPAEPEAFLAVSGRIVSPTDFSTVDISPFASSYPVRVQLSNPSTSPVTLTLEIEADETPAPLGSEQRSSSAVQASLRGGEVRDFDVAMPVASWGAFADYVDVELTARVRRSPGESARQIDRKSFVVE